MSSIAFPNGDDFPEASTKHIEDATALWKAKRFDGAAYHAGYVVECVLKTIVVLETGSHPGKRHNLQNLSSRAIHLASMLGSRTARYATPRHLPTYRAILSGWRPEVRYWPAGQISYADALTWMRAAWRVYNSTIIRMKLDGVV